MRLRRWIVGVIVALGGALLLVVPALAAGVFPDVPSTHSHVTAIEDLAARNIISGYDNGTFGPEKPVLRQQFAKMIVGTMALPVSEADICEFGDVTKGGPDTFYPDNFVAVCADYGITQGKTPTTFAPYDNILRLQVITMIVRAADNLLPGTLQTPPAGWSGMLNYSDPDHGANLRKADYNGLLAGLQGIAAGWNGYASSSRGECAQLLYNLLQLQGGGTTSTTSTTAPPASTTTTGPTTTTSSTTTTTTVPSGSPLQIVSANYDEPRDDNDNLNEEYITFQVLVTGSLLGYAIEDENGWRYDFPDRVFTAGQVLKLHTGIGTDTQTDLYWGRDSAVSNSGGNAVKLLDPQDQVVASYSW